MRLPHDKHPIWTVALAVVAIALAIIIYRDATSTQSGPNYCGQLPPAAQATCKVQLRGGTWVVVSSGTSSWLELIDANGKIIQTSQLQ